MNVIIISIIVLTLAQVIICHFSLWWFIALIARIMFSLRIIGATFKVKHLAIVEGVALAICLLYNMLFRKGAVPWLRIGLFAVISLICVGLMFLDDLLYVYVIEDEED